MKNINYIGLHSSYTLYKWIYIFICISASSFSIIVFIFSLTYVLYLFQLLYKCTICKSWKETGELEEALRNSTAGASEAAELKEKAPWMEAAAAPSKSSFMQDFDQIVEECEESCSPTAWISSRENHCGLRQPIPVLGSQQMPINLSCCHCHKISLCPLH